MADVAGGSIVWKLSVDDSSFNAQLAKNAASAKAFGSSLHNVGTSALGSMSGNISNAFGNIAGVLGRAADSVNSFANQLGSKLLVAGGLASLGLGYLAKESLNMVKNVQSATLALSAYTGSAQSAADITRELIDFARSPQGVLFNRDELLSITQRLAGLRVEGLRTKDELVGFIKSVAPAAAVFKQNAGSAQYFGEILGQILGTGKLLTQDYRQLANAGIILDRSLIGQSLSAEQLRVALMNAIPASLLDKQALTVEGQMIRLKTAFRQLGDNLLGVQYGANELGATFTSGSLGEAALKAVGRLTEKLKSPEVIASMAKLGQTAKTALGYISTGVEFALSHIDQLVKAFGIAVGVFVALKAAALALTGLSTISSLISGLASGVSLLAGAVSAFSAAGGGLAGVLAALGGPVTLIVLAIAALVAGIAYLVIKFKLLDDIARVVGQGWNWLVGVAKKVWEAVKPVWDMLKSAFEVLSNVVTTMLIPAFQYLWEKIQPFLPVLEKVAIVFGVVIVGAIMIFLIALTLVVSVVAAAVAGIAYAIGWLVDMWNKQWNWIKDKVEAVIGAVVGFVVGGIGKILTTWENIKQIGRIVSDAFSNAYNAIAGFVGRFVEAGRNIIAGVIRGVSSAAGDLIGYIASLFGDVIAIAKRILHISSPSKVFEEIGRNTMEGMALGILNSAGLVEQALNTAMPTTALSTMDDTSFVGSGGVTNVFQPKQLTESDIDMAANRSAYQQGMSLR